MRTISPKQKLLQLRLWIIKRRKLLILLTVLLIVTASGATYYVLANQTKVELVANTKIQPVESEPEPEPIKYYSPLTGNLVNSETATKLPVTGVMIENSPDARPQSGLKNSGIVFEAIAEGGITRFLVLYQQEKPQMIGPVRSLRLYDVDWLAAFDAGIAHVGGSLYALNEIRNGSYRDLDQFFNSGSYWRASDRYAPHNVYTSFDRLDALNTAKGFTKSSFTGFERTDGVTAAKLTATNIAINISSDLYNSTYAYSGKTNTYTRSQGGALHTDREDGKITPSVVIAMMVDETTVLQDGYREDITTIGSGKATIFQNGTAISATWYKTSKTKQIAFKDSKGKVIPLVRGQTWITAVPNGKGSVEWN